MNKISSDRTIKKAVEYAMETNQPVFRLVNYFDVWGNSEEGYEINNLCHENFFIIGDNFSEQDFINRLYNLGFLNTKKVNCDSWNLHEVSANEKHEKPFFPVYRLDEFHQKEYLPEITELSFPVVYNATGKKFS